MNHVSNLADAMLVVAVGLMLALVVKWDIDIVNYTPTSQEPSQVTEGEVEELEADVESLDSTSQDDEDAVSIEDYGLKEYGTVYVDENGQLYVIEE